MEHQPLPAIILDAWQVVTHYVASGHGAEFTGRKKEHLVLARLRRQIQQAWPSLAIRGPDTQVRFDGWPIDLVCSRSQERVAVEGKFKVQSDGAVPDNRKDAFFDLFKLEHYVSSGEYSSGLFLWLTNESGYLRIATGDSSDFSTHNGRVYEAETPLNARRARSPGMPLPLTLSRQYVFNWRQVLPNLGWYSLVLKVE